MRTQIAGNSIREGRDRSRLPELSQEWIEIIRGSLDFLGINYYTSRIVSTLPQPPARRDPSFGYDERMDHKVKPEWKRAKSGWLFSVPTGMADLMRSK